MMLFAYRHMLCRITEICDCGLDSADPNTYLFSLQPIGGGSEIPGLRAWDFEEVENVTLFPQRMPASMATPPVASLRKPSLSEDSSASFREGANSNYGDV